MSVIPPFIREDVPRVPHSKCGSVQLLHWRLWGEQEFQVEGPAMWRHTTHGMSGREYGECFLLLSSHLSSQNWTPHWTPKPQCPFEIWALDAWPSCKNSLKALTCFQLLLYPLLCRPALEILGSPEQQYPWGVPLWSRELLGICNYQRSVCISFQRTILSWHRVSSVLFWTLSAETNTTKHSQEFSNLRESLDLSHILIK